VAAATRDVQVISRPGATLGLGKRAAGFPGAAGGGAPGPEGQIDERRRAEDGPGGGEAAIEIEGQAHAVEQRQEPVGRHGRGQRLRRPADAALLEVGDQGVVGDQLDGLVRAETQTVVELGELLHHGDEGLAVHETTSLQASDNA